MVISKQCYIDDDTIVIITDCDKYYIDLDRCSTPEDILGWIDHLCPKVWVNTGMIKEFINLATQKHNIQIHPLG